MNLKKLFEKNSAESAPVAATVYDSAAEALAATDEFYRSQTGFGYDLDKIKAWLKAYVPVPKKGRVLDLCCGDGIWSLGMKSLSPALELYGIDLSQGGIERAREIVGANDEHFVVGDVEQALPFPEQYFDFIFARGTGLYNQHDMSRPATVQVIEMWHRYLTPNGRFCAIYGSTPELMGQYTPIDEVKLPYNRAPRHSQAVDFDGGKFHHTIESFHAPFWAAESIEIVDYSFVKKKHVILTRRKP